MGQAEFSDSMLQFESTIASACSLGADAVIFAGSLCYVEDPLSFIREVEILGVPFIILDRLPVIKGVADRITLQEVFEPIYPASYPVRLFGEQRFLETTLKEWRLIEKWDCDLQVSESLGSRYRGYFLERR